MKIPSNIPYIGLEEEKAVVQAMKDGHLIGNGPIAKRVQKQIQEMFDVKHVLLTPSCTAALEMAMLILDIGPGDEVILPSFTFVSAANCVVLRGATPVFAEIKPDTLNINPEEILRRVTERTKVIMPMHYAGISCDMDVIMKIAKEHNLYVVEDAAQGVDALYKGQYQGTIGHVGCYSFHGTKNITCGEGGAFLTNDDDLARKAEMIQEKGTNRAAFIRGKVDKYSWVSVGSSYVLSDLLAAILEVQLPKREEIKTKRKKIWNQYYEGLKSLEKEGKLILPVIPTGCESNYHIFFFRVENEEIRNKILNGLRVNGIGATFHYVPLHSSPFAKEELNNNIKLLETEIASRTLVRLPLYGSMDTKEVIDVIEILSEEFDSSTIS